MTILTKEPSWLQNAKIYLIDIIIREATLSWHFINGDISSAIIPALLFITAAGISYMLSFYDLLLALGKGVLYFWLYLWAFCLANQVEGLDEDKLNKTQRPLVQGLVSIRGALLRWAIISFLFCIVGLWISVLQWALLWLMVIILHNFCGWAKHWFAKNLLMSFGIIVQLAAAWQIVGPITTVAWWWILLSAAAIFPLVSVQDLRDMAGDQVNNRKTLPLVIGEYPTRVLLSLCFSLLPILIHLELMVPAGLTLSVISCDIVLAVVSWIIAARIMLYCFSEADHNTYLLFTYWYCFEIASSIFCIGKTY